MQHVRTLRHLVSISKDKLLKLPGWGNI